MPLISKSNPFIQDDVKFEGISTELREAIEDRGVDILDCPAVPISAELETSEEVIVIRECEQEIGHAYEMTYELL
jgi:hypothetical protein